MNREDNRKLERAIEIESILPIEPPPTKPAITEYARLYGEGQKLLRELFPKLTTLGWDLSDEGLR